MAYVRATRRTSGDNASSRPHALVSASRRRGVIWPCAVFGGRAPSRPPSMATLVPAVWATPGEAKDQMSSATSCGSPARPSTVVTARSSHFPFECVGVRKGDCAPVGGVEEVPVPVTGPWAHAWLGSIWEERSM